MTGCASKVTKGYAPPPKTDSTLSHTINAPFDEVWHAAIETLGTQFFEITHVEKESGLLTFSYNSSADPSEFIDCGTASIIETDPYGKTSEYHYKPEAQNVRVSYRVYRGLIEYYTATYEQSSRVAIKTNLIFKKTGASQTTVSAASQYTLTMQNNRKIQVAPEVFQAPPPEVVNFSTTEPSNTGQGMQCVSKHTFESRLIKQIEAKVTK